MASNPYAGLSSFERLLLLIATFVRHPGVGSADPTCRESDHDALQEVQLRMQQVAQDLGIDLPSYSLHTLRKDLKTLRRYGILERRMYRWGYYLGTGVMRQSELQAALQALASQAQHQGDPQVRHIYETLERRLRGLNLELQGQLFYPVRTQLDRAIIHTDPEEMMKRGHYRRTLIHHLKQVEAAILEGQALELYRRSDPYGQVGIEYIQVYPLQLVYSDIAWYLLYETCSSGHLAIERVDRLSDYVKPIEAKDRGIAAQRESLQVAHQLLTRGWGLYLGDPDEQRQERAGTLPLVNVMVRFFPPVTTFILEGDRRHASQKIYRHPKGHSKPIEYVDYQVELPPRSLPEFSRWVYRFTYSAKVLAPPELVQQHRDAARQLAQRYGVT